ncbi:Beta-1,3-glucan-binding protein [Termitomyces sp. T112]|nr:Beta-1,3-glucan-binding protein [Termitomyces sp. T112]
MGDLAPPRPFFLAGSRPRRPSPAEPPAAPAAAPPPPPSAFPFQAYPGNPDPLPSSYGRRRVSLESLANSPAYAYISGSDSDCSATLPRSGSLGDLHRPQPPFAADHGLASSSSTSDLYRASAAAPIAAALTPAQIFRPPFLSPASRPTSTLSWAPPVLEHNASSTALHLSPSTSNLALAHRPPLPSTMLEKVPEDKSVDSLQVVPRQVNRHKMSWWVTFACIVLGVAGAALLCYTGVNDAKKKMLDESQLCLVMSDDFSTGSLNDAYWSRDVQVDDRGFQITTNTDKNLFLLNNELYIFPTLTRDDVPDYASDGQTYDVPGCTADVPPAPAPAPASNATTTTTTAPRGAHTHVRRQQQDTNSTDTGNSTTTPAPPALGVTPASGGNSCKAVTNTAAGSVINPVMSAKITTKGKVGIKYGRVEVVAKIASGDWLWPAVWMMPENNTYGPWPLSGEIDILEARGNGPSYPAQGTNFVRSQLQYGLDQTLTPITVPGTQPPPLTKDLFGWFSLKRTSFDKSFHTYVVEWDESFIRFWVDGRVRSILEVDVDPKTKPSKTGEGGGGTFWDKGKFPATAQNKTTGSVVVVKDPWVDGGVTAPFDQRFYLNIDLGVGGRTGWFPDDEGGKPWFDGSATAMRDFNNAIDTWSATWPQSADDRAFRIASVKMWSKEPCGNANTNTK